MDRLTTDEHLDLRLTKKMWKECLRNRQVREIMASLGVPESERLNLFDILDSDENGVLSSVLLMGRGEGAARASDTIACRLRVRAIQHHLVSVVGRQITDLHVAVEEIRGSL